jgi:hypothetical protein
MVALLWFLCVHPSPLPEARLQQPTEISINQDGPSTEDFLRPIISLGQRATPILLKMARSRDAVTRAAAAMGLGMVRSPRGRKMLEQLFHDQTLVKLRDGCDSREVAVGWFADRALDHYPPK